MILLRGVAPEGRLMPFCCMLVTLLRFRRAVPSRLAHRA